MIRSEGTSGLRLDGLVGARAAPEMLDEARLHEAEQLFHELVDAPPPERQVLLTARCGADVQLQTVVRRMLDADSSGMDGFMSRPLAEPPRRVGDAPREVDAGLPQTIGRYTIVREIGRGGMGVVYEARQQSPQRAVALKVLRTSFPTRESLHRFTHEAEILGLLQHPGVAHVYEAGVAEVSGAAGAQSVPFFAMELVRGAPLTAYARTRALDSRQRLELLARVCDAVQHAHQKGVIHRDLKPANILVDESGQSKVLDFGIARAAGAEIETASLHTAAGQLIGTLPYMSPEQVGGDPGEIDRRSDVYALGAVLFELLAGQMPFNLNDLSLADAARIIAVDDPPRLSTLDARLAGDIETIVATALARDKERRYASAAELGQDIRRYLAGEPIEARRDSALYVLGKTVRRHRWPFALAGLLLLSMTAVTVVSVLHARREQALAQAEQRAAREAREARELATREKVRAQQQAERSETVVSLLNEMLQRSELRDETGRELSFAEHVELFAATLSERLKDQPEIEARVRSTMGDTFVALDWPQSAAGQHQRALELHRKLAGEREAAVSAEWHKLVKALIRAGRSDRARERAEEALGQARQLYGEQHLVVADRLVLLAEATAATSDLTEAEALARESLTMREALWQHPAHELADNLALLGRICVRAGRSAEAEEYYRRALDTYVQTVGASEDAAMTRCLYEVWQLLKNMRRYQDALRAMLDAAAAIERRHGRLHPLVAECLYYATGLFKYFPDHERVSEQEALARESLEIRARLYDEQSVAVAMARHQLANVLILSSQFDEAIELHRLALPVLRTRLDVFHQRETSSSLVNLGIALRDGRGELAGAEAALREAIDIRRRLDEPHQRWVIGEYLLHLALVCRLSGRVDEAEALEAEAADRREEHPLPRWAGKARALERIALRLEELGALAAAEPVWREVLANRASSIPGHWKLFDTMSRLGGTLTRLGRFAEAEPLLLEGYGSIDPPPEEAHHQLEALARLIDLYESWHAAQPDAGYEAKAGEWRRLSGPGAN